MLFSKNACNKCAPFPNKSWSDDEEMFPSGKEDEMESS